ncbi:retrotransposon protein, putative, ty1-copia subclass [Tanacetum coccineum]
MASPKAAKWKEAIKSEIQSMYDNQVWNLVDTTPDLKTVGCKWIFKKKTDMDGKVHTYKARLVAKGYTQTHRIDYEETFSPVAKIKSIRIMLAIVAFHDYKIWQMDVKIAFLNGRLTEDVFMAQPEGFENTKYPKRVCKLQKTIYGLKQASRSWNLYFHEKVTQFGFSRSEDESCIYVKVSGSVVVFLVLYVDDILLIGNDIPTLQSVKDWLGKCFAMKDLGDATYILAIKIYRDRSKRLIGLNQYTYLDKILKRFKMENSKKENLPLHHGIKISKDLCPKTNEKLDRMSRVPYASAIGSIMYAMTCTRPDVSFALSMSEYIAAYEASKEAIWMKNFIRDLGVVLTVQDPIEIFRDNKSVVALTKEPKDHEKSKHIGRKYHFV